MHHKPGQSFHCALQMPIDAHCCTSVLNSSVYFWIHYHLPLIFSSVLWLKKTKERNWRKWKKKQAVSKENLQRTFRESGELLIKTSLKFTQKSPAPRKERKWGVAQDFYTAPNTFYITFFIEHNISIKCSGYRLFTACFMVIKCKYLAYINM